MRVIAGEARGRRLLSPAGLEVRPTADRFRETLFDIIGPDIIGRAFLDLFAGSGAVGIEALSRGAEFAAFADNSPAAAKVIEKNIALVKYQSKSLVLEADCLEALRVLAEGGRSFDFIFMDPPYHKNLCPACLKRVWDLGLLREDGLIVVEKAPDEELPDAEGFVKARVKGYRATEFVFLRKAFTE
ncbi:MAG: 16S rRNA (guanine(966)-N(2))-methyltransferase RsmD [Firmicutes bacterium]|nr:16S rRNA (guanine(966)-N(2))-methyltransferase RsmD [Bacillota bacterium]